MASAPAMPTKESSKSSAHAADEIGLNRGYPPYGSAVDQKNPGVPPQPVPVEPPDRPHHLTGRPDYAPRPASPVPIRHRVVPVGPVRICCINNSLLRFNQPFQSMFNQFDRGLQTLLAASAALVHCVSPRVARSVFRSHMGYHIPPYHALIEHIIKHHINEMQITIN